MNKVSKWIKKVACYYAKESVGASIPIGIYCPRPTESAKKYIEKKNKQL